jgi:hypothetical protein
LFHGNHLKLKMEQLLEEENCPIFKLFMYCVELEKKKSYLSCSIVLGAS